MFLIWKTYKQVIGGVFFAFFFNLSSSGRIEETLPILRVMVSPPLGLGLGNFGESPIVQRSPRVSGAGIAPPSLPSPRVSVTGGMAPPLQINNSPRTSIAGVAPSLSVSQPSIQRTSSLGIGSLSPAPEPLRPRRSSPGTNTIVSLPEIKPAGPKTSLKGSDSDSSQVLTKSKRGVFRYRIISNLKLESKLESKQSSSGFNKLAILIKRSVIRFRPGREPKKLVQLSSASQKYWRRMRLINYSRAKPGFFFRDVSDFDGSQFPYFIHPKPEVNFVLNSLHGLGGTKGVKDIVGELEITDINFKMENGRIKISLPFVGKSLASELDSELVKLKEKQKDKEFIQSLLLNPLIGPTTNQAKNSLVTPTNRLYFSLLSFVDSDKYRLQQDNSSLHIHHIVPKYCFEQAAKPFETIVNSKEGKEMSKDITKADNVKKKLTKELKKIKGLETELKKKKVLRDPVLLKDTQEKLAKLELEKIVTEENFQNLIRQINSPFAKKVEEASGIIKALSKLRESPGNKISVPDEIHVLLHEVLSRTYGSSQDANAAVLLAKGKNTNLLFNRSQDLFVEALMESYEKENLTKYQSFTNSIDSITPLNEKVNKLLSLKASKKKIFLKQRETHRTNTKNRAELDALKKQRQFLLEEQNKN